MKFILIVKLMMRNKILLLFLLISFNVYSQNINCNRKCYIKTDQKLIPQDVCIPEGYIISQIHSKYNFIDFNNDGLKDFVIAIDKQKRTIGDTSFLIFYKMNSDSSFSLYKQYHNIYPVYFDPNNEYPDLQSVYLNELFDCYLDPNPLYSLQIRNDSIIIYRKLDRHDIEKVKFVYQFDLNLNDWTLINKTRITKDTIYQEKSDRSKLSQFSFCNN